MWLLDKSSKNKWFINIYFYQLEKNDNFYLLLGLSFWKSGLRGIKTVNTTIFKF